MNPIYEDVSTATYHYNVLDKPIVTTHTDGRKYQAVGESYGGNVPFGGRRIMHLLAVIGMLAITILLLGTPIFFCPKFGDTLIDQIQKTRGVSVHYVPRQPPSHWQKMAIRGAQKWIEIILPGVSSRGTKTYESVACCVRFAYEGGEAKKQFIFKDTRGLETLTKDDLSLEAKKTKEPLMKLLDKEINLESEYIDLDMAIIYKEKGGRIITKEVLGEHYTNHHEEIASTTHHRFETMDQFDPSILDRVGFSEECLDSKGNFKEGKFFKSLNI